MHIEIEYAVNFLVATIKEKYTATAQTYDKLKERLTKLLHERYENHWYSDKPIKGSAYRCINVSVEDNTIDQVLKTAGEECGISMQKLVEIFDNGLALWVDPNDVSCRIGKGSIFFIYKKLNDANLETNSSLSTSKSATAQRRPQQRPRSISPKTTSMYTENFLQSTAARTRSSTPPGFTSYESGNFYQSYSTPSLSSDKLQELWNSIPNTTSYNSSTPSFPSYSQSQYTPSSSSTSYNYNTTTFSNYSSTNDSYNKPNSDSSYSFNQYSSYYSPPANPWKKNNRQQVKQYQSHKPIWQDDKVYQRYHWSRGGDVKNSVSVVAGNNIALKNYGYTSSRQAQEVY